MANEQKSVTLYKAKVPTAMACPRCQKVLNAATGVQTDDGTPRPPKEGDITCCAYCGSILAFAKTEDGFKFRFATDDDLAVLDIELRRLLFDVSEHPPLAPGKRP